MKKYRAFTWFVILFAVLLSGCSGGKDSLKRDYRSHAIITVEPSVLAADERQWEEVDKELRRKVYFNDRITVEILEMSKSKLSHDIKKSHRPEDTVGYVLDGSFVVTVQKITKQIGAGGVYIVPSNVPFSVLPATEKATVMNIYTPTREDLRTYPDEARFNENDIKSFVYRWYGFMDDRADLGSFLTMLHDYDISVELKGKKIESWQDFQDWYNQWLKTVETNTHKLKDMKVVFLGRGQYSVDFTVSVTEKPYDGKVLKKDYKENWVVIDTGLNYPKIKQTVSREMKK